MFDGERTTLPVATVRCTYIQYLEVYIFIVMKVGCPSLCFTDDVLCRCRDDFQCLKQKGAAGV